LGGTLTTVLRVKEEGTEAAAATVAAMVKGMPLPPVFFYLLHHLFL
jgi:serine protease inhibitor